MYNAQGKDLGNCNLYRGFKIITMASYNTAGGPWSWSVTPINRIKRAFGAGGLDSEPLAVSLAKDYIDEEVRLVEANVLNALGAPLETGNLEDNAHTAGIGLGAF